jgi:hypothetical protein
MDPIRDIRRATILKGMRAIARAAMPVTPATRAIAARTLEGIAARTLAAIAERMVAGIAEWAIVEAWAIAPEITQALGQVWAATQLRAVRYP